MAKETVSSRCPRCGKTIEWAGAEAEGAPLGSDPLATGNLWPKDLLRYRPFCSETCKLIDLGKWIDEEYRIPSENPLPDEKEPPEVTLWSEKAPWPEGRGGGGK